MFMFFWRFIKRSFSILEFLQCPIFFFLTFSFSLSFSSSAQASSVSLSHAHSTICLSIIFTGEGILVGAQLRYIDRRQVYRHWFRRQESHRLWDRILMRRIAPCERLSTGHSMETERSPRILSEFDRRCYDGWCDTVVSSLCYRYCYSLVDKKEMGSSAQGRAKRMNQRFGFSRIFLSSFENHRCELGTRFLIN